MNRYNVLVVFVLVSMQSFAVRIKDLVKIRGIKDNQLIGYGLVVGLPGTGDRDEEFTENSLNLALKGLGVDIKAKKISARNAASVLVTANLPPLAKVGGKVDINVASIGSASSLEGGTLVVTPLKGSDDKVYAVAQGRIPVSRPAERATAAFQGMLSVQLAEGAILEKDVAFNLADQDSLKFHLNTPDFTTASRIAYRMNSELGGKFAEAIDASTIQVILPYLTDESIVEFVSKVENLEVEPDRTAKVVVNRKTGTVVLGEFVKLYPISLAHNNLKIQIKPEGSGQNVRVPQANPDEPIIPPSPKQPRTVKFSDQSASVADIVTSLNEIGAAPDDIVFILQGLKASGSLVADLEVR